MGVNGKPVPGRVVNFRFANGWVGSLVNASSQEETELVDCVCYPPGSTDDSKYEQGPTMADDDIAVRWLNTVRLRKTESGR